MEINKITGAVIGAAIEVHKALGPGLLESAYEECLCHELKSIEKLLPIHDAQVLTYLKLTGLKVGLLINFNVAALRRGIKRIIL